MPAYAAAVRDLAERKELPALFPAEGLKLGPESFRDGLHLNDAGHTAVAVRTAQLLGAGPRTVALPDNADVMLASLIRKKNRLWFHYARPQNWAFLNGDRTVQPSSRDHRDPEKRWFPEEMKQWLPLIAMQEEEIWKFARGLGTQ